MKKVETKNLAYLLNKKQYKIPTTSVVNYYYKKLRFFSKKKKKSRVKRNEKISKAVANKKVFIHQGRVWTKLYLTKYHIGYKYGEFSCTKKPFLFRPKKKKINVMQKGKLNLWPK